MRLHPQLHCLSPCPCRLYGLVNEESVFAVAPDRGTILNSRVDQSKGGRTQYFVVRAP